MFIEATDVIDVLVSLRIDSLSQLTSEHLSVVAGAWRLCELCGKQDGVFWCTDCEQRLCGDCRNVHQAMKLLRHHKITDAD